MHRSVDLISISEVVQWCKDHNLLLNAAKTKELIFDFRHCNISHVPLSIDNVEICDNFKYLGITFDCKLKWSNHCTLKHSVYTVHGL